MKKACSIRVYGKVQNVGFRYYTAKTAQQFDIKGYVKNMSLTAQCISKRKGWMPIWKPSSAGAARGRNGRGLTGWKYRISRVAGHRDFSVR